MTTKKKQKNKKQQIFEEKITHNRLSIKYLWVLYPSSLIQAAKYTGINKAKKRQEKTKQKQTPKKFKKGEKNEGNIYLAPGMNFTKLMMNQ